MVFGNDTSSTPAPMSSSVCHATYLYHFKADRNPIGTNGFYG
jgi:hypothetical protein